MNNLQLVQISSLELWVGSHSSHSSPFPNGVNSSSTPHSTVVHSQNTAQQLVYYRPQALKQFVFELPCWWRPDFHEPQIHLISMNILLFHPGFKRENWSSADATGVTFELSKDCELWCLVLTCLTASVLFNQSNHLKLSTKDCDWLILACFIRVQLHADARSVRSENEVGFENEGVCGGNKRILYHKTNKEASAVLCSVVTHLRSS